MVMDQVSKMFPSGLFTVFSADGTLYVSFERNDRPSRGGEWRWVSRRISSFGIGVRGIGALPEGRLWARFSGPASVVIVPYWVLCVMFSVCPATAAVMGARRYWLRTRAAPNACAKCGYDLRATPGRCPECGTPASVSTVEAPPRA